MRLQQEQRARLGFAVGRGKGVNAFQAQDTSSAGTPSYAEGPACCGQGQVMQSELSSENSRLGKRERTTTSWKTFNI